MNANIKTKGYKKWCKEHGYTEEQMQKFWDDAVIEGGSYLIEYALKQGCTWYNLQLYQIEQLPGLAERLHERKIKEAQEKAEKEKAEQEKNSAEKYFWEHLEEIFLDKIEKNEELTEEELEKFKLYWGTEIQTIQGEKHRWQQEMTTIKEYNGRYFAIEWMEGLTEYQENSYDNQPYEVEEYVRTVVLHEWRKK